MMSDEIEALTWVEMQVIIRQEYDTWYQTVESGRTVREMALNELHSTCRMWYGNNRDRQLLVVEYLEQLAVKAFGGTR